MFLRRIVFLLFFPFLLVVIASCNKREKATDAVLLLKEGKQAFNDNDLLTSFSKLQKARTIFDNTKDSNGYFESTVYLCLLYNKIGQNDESYNLLMPLKFIDLPDQDSYASLYYLRMKSYFYLVKDKNYKEAKHFTKRCITFAKEKHPTDTALLYMDKANLAELYFLAGEYKNAEYIVDKLIKAKPVTFKMYLSELYYCQGLLMYHNKRYDSAYTAFTKSLSASRDYEAFDNEKNTLQMLCKLDSIANDLNNYIRHKHEYDSLKEELESNEIYFKVALIQSQHKIDLIKQENAKSKTIYLLSVMLLLIVLTTIILIFLFVYKNIKNKQRVTALEKQRLNSKVEMDRMEKELFELRMEKKNQLLDQAYKDNIAMSLILAKQDTKDDTKQMMEKQVRETESLIRRKTERVYSSLTNNDIRLMALIKLDIDSSDIASALNITIESLTKAKYRLRKKLGLHSTEDLRTFIKSIT